MSLAADAAVDAACVMVVVVWGVAAVAPGKRERNFFYRAQRKEKKGLK